ncbi:MAG: hypothetical protein JST86_12475 [Bacteroidetes bacterium]|nr:hypothetical protein [Bacteroidota bacterium]
MGHERVGFLPKSKSWNKVVESIHGYSEATPDVSIIAEQALKNIRQKFLALNTDLSFLASFKCLVVLSYANKAENPIGFLSENGIGVNENGSLFQLTSATQKWMEKQSGSKEYNTLATKALVDTINNWVKTNQPGASLFGKNESILASWEKATNGAGFCEVSRDYFSRFTTNYLSYFLDRAASAQIDSITERNQFSDSIKNHISEISTHAFETSKIAQSFAAGWFNSNAKTEFPSDKKIKGFLGIVTKKFHDEFSREGRGKK